MAEQDDEEEEIRNRLRDWSVNSGKQDKDDINELCDRLLSFSISSIDNSKLVLRVICELSDSWQNESLTKIANDNYFAGIVTDETRPLIIKQMIELMRLLSLEQVIDAIMYVYVDDKVNNSVLMQDIR
jgi:hypothetical protein